MQIYIHRDDADFGPYTVEEAQAHLSTGDLLPEDWAWYEGAPDWMALEEIPGVMPLPAAEPTPEPKPAPQPTPRRTNTGLPPWIPPRRSEDPDLAASKPTSFHTPALRPPIGITNLSAGAGKSARPAPGQRPASKIRTTSPVTTPMAAPSVAPEEPDIETSAADESVAPLPFPPRSLRDTGIRNMRFGGLWLGVGLVATLVAYKMGFVETHPGTFLMTGVVVVYGFFQFLRGSLQYRKA
jgi:hypothetical protein